jgi:hypothetical protein
MEKKAEQISSLLDGPSKVERLGTRSRYREFKLKRQVVEREEPKRVE